MSMRWTKAGLIAVIVFGIGLFTQNGRSQQPAASGDLDVIQLRPNVYMIAGAGANITVHLGPTGVILVDSGTAEMADKTLAAIGRLTKERIRFILNTASDPAHTGGNDKLSAAGLSVMPTGGAGVATKDAQSNNGRASIFAQDNVMVHLSSPDEKTPAAPMGSWPTDTYTGAAMSLYLNDDGVQMIHQPAAHSDGDSIVFFRRADVIATGEIFDLSRFPFIDIENGGTIQGELAALNRLMELAIPAVPFPWMEGRTLLVPAHGQVADQSDLAEYRDMVTMVRDRIAASIKEGMTLEQVKKSNPLQGYRQQYGADAGPWTTDKIVSTIYENLKGQK